MTETQSNLHNQLVGGIIAQIVKPPLESGGGVNDVLVLLESVVTGVLSAVVALGGDNKVLDIFTAGVRDRMAEIRLGGLKVGGSA